MTLNPFLLESLEADGFTVTATAGVLSVGPKERLTSELRTRIKAAKRYILDDLEARERQSYEADWNRIAAACPRIDGAGHKGGRDERTNAGDCQSDSGYVRCGYGNGHGSGPASCHS